MLEVKVSRGRKRNQRISKALKQRKVPGKKNQTVD